MEDTLPQYPQGRLSSESPIDHSNNSRLLKLSIFGLLVLLPVVAVSAYFLGKQSVAAAQILVSPPTLITSTSTPNPTAKEKESEKESEKKSVTEMTYTNVSYGYTFQYPQGWKVTKVDYETPGKDDTNVVYIFNPDDNPKQSFYSGMIVEYVGMTNELPRKEGFTIINGMDTVSTETPHGLIYYVLIPGTDQFLKISGASGNTANEETNQGLRDIFNSFRFKNY